MRPAAICAVADAVRHQTACAGARKRTRCRHLPTEIACRLRIKSRSSRTDHERSVHAKTGGHALINTRGVDFIPADTETGRLIRSIDWSKTPLGAPEHWSPSLRMMVPFVLANRFPLLLWWGPEYVGIYNDAYAPILGAKHPRAMGQPTREVWTEIWDLLKPLIDTPFHGGPATWIEDFELDLRRHGFREETHFTVAYSAVPDESVDGGIGGVLATVH